MRRQRSLGGKPIVASDRRQGALQQGRNYGLKNWDSPVLPHDSAKLPRPWQSAVPSGAVPDINPAAGGKVGPAVAAILVEGAQ
jgi:hypothetical protein